MKPKPILLEAIKRFDVNARRKPRRIVDGHHRHEALRQLGRLNREPARQCVLCGCTETHSCLTAVGPCFWFFERLCSACAFSKFYRGLILRLAFSALAEYTVSAYPAITSSTNRGE